MQGSELLHTDNDNLNPQVHVRAVARAVAILEQFSLDQPTMSLTEISIGLGLSKSTTHRLLSTLQRLDLVKLDPDNGRYRLGLKVFQLGSVVLKGMELVAQADPILAHLVEETDETAFLVVPDGNEALCLRRLDGRNYVRFQFLETGKKLAYNCGAASRVLLAHMSEEQRRHIIDDHTRKMTTYTLIEPEDLERDGIEIRTRGYSLSKEDVTLHACALGAPVRDHTGTVIAAISISAIVQRFSTEELPYLAETIVNAGQELSRRMGYTATIS
jgi:DNA-binding IclR family transcriptional regulator